MTSPMEMNENASVSGGHLSRKAQHAQLAWAIFGALVASGDLRVNFAQTNWASQVEVAVTTIAATLDQHDE